MLFKWEIESSGADSNRSNWTLSPYGIFFIIFFFNYLLSALMKKSIWQITNALFSIRFFQSVWTPEPFQTREHAKIKKYFLQNAIFHFWPFFAPIIMVIVGFPHTHSTHSHTYYDVSTRLHENRSCIYPSIPIFTPYFWRYFCIFSVLRVVNRLFSTHHLWFWYCRLCVPYSEVNKECCKSQVYCSSRISLSFEYIVLWFVRGKYNFSVWT